MTPGQAFNPYKLFTGIFIPESLVRFPDISPTAKLCYGRLARYAGEDGRCYPAVGTLAAEIGVKDRQARRCLAELEDAELIRREIQDGRTTMYVFLWHSMFSGETPRPETIGVPRSDMTAHPGHLRPPTPDICDRVPRTDMTAKESQLRESVKNLCVSPRAADLNGQVSQRFGEFWNRYPRQQRKDFTASEWVSVVTVEIEAAVFGCLDRYLASDEVARGVVMNPDKWLYEQHRNGWQGNWPAARERMAPAARNGKQAAIDQGWEAIANGNR